MTGMHKGVWIVVRKAALLGMDQGRGWLYKWHKQQDTPGEEPLPAHWHTAQQAAGRVAVAAFWDRLHNIVGLGLWPAGWLDHIPTDPP